jgi:hypothetical protein
VHAALQLAFFHAGLRLDVPYRLHVQVAALVRSAGERQLARRQAKIFHPAALDEWQRLEGLGARAQKGDRVRVAIGRK